MQEWFVLFTKPRAEFRAYTALNSRGIHAFLPTVPGQPPNNDSRQPLFPRYIFAQADLAETSPDVLRWTPGLVRPLRMGDRYVRISQEAIDLIQEQIREIEGQGGLPGHDFRPGDRVRIRSGPFQGLYAIFDGPRTPSERVRILVDFLDRTNSVEIPVDHLEPAQGLTKRERRPRRTRGRGRRIKSGGGDSESGTRA